MDVKIKELKYQQNEGFVSSYLDLELSGNDMNLVVANTLRRTIIDDIPIYAFEYVNIEYNNSVFNNDMMKIRLRQLPIYGIDSGLNYLNPIYWEKIDYTDYKNRPKHEAEKNIEAIINVHNNKNEIMHVTTNDMRYYIDNVETKYVAKNKNHPILLISLRPNETFKCIMKGCLGTGERDNIWSGGHCYYDENIEKNTIKFTVESYGQVDEYSLIIKACGNIRKRLGNIYNEIKKRVDLKEIRPSNSIIIELDNEDHTICNLINDSLQSHKDIIFSGISKPDLLVKSMKFKIQTINKSKSPIEPFFDVINNLTSLFKNIENQIETLKKSKK